MFEESINIQIKENGTTTKNIRTTVELFEAINVENWAFQRVITHQEQINFIIFYEHQDAEQSFDASSGYTTNTTEITDISEEEANNEENRPQTTRREGEESGERETEKGQGREERKKKESVKYEENPMTGKREKICPNCWKTFGFKYKEEQNDKKKILPKMHRERKRKNNKK